MFESNHATDEPSSDDIGFDSGEASLTCSSSCSNGAIGTCSPIDCYSGFSPTGSYGFSTYEFSPNASCECYSCACAVRNPTPLPSSAPSSLPTPSPTQNPTPGPTPTTEVAVIPEGALSLFATKPDRATDSFYLLNTNKQTLAGTIELTRSSLPNTTNVTVAPAVLSIAPGESIRVLAHVQSAGLVPREYNLTWQVTVSPAVGLPTSRSVFAALIVKAKADAATTEVFVRGSPTLGVEWNGGVTIRPHDSDGFRILTASGEAEFQITLQSMAIDNSTVFSTSCDLRWSNNEMQYESVGCVVPDASLAGVWQLEVTLDDTVIFLTSVHAKCPMNFFEVDHAGYSGHEAMGYCAPCPLSGVDCLAGTTLTTLSLKPGYWRSGAGRQSHRMYGYYVTQPPCLFVVR